jgi:hypothetical protein
MRFNPVWFYFNNNRSAVETISIQSQVLTCRCKEKFFVNINVTLLYKTCSNGVSIALKSNYPKSTIYNIFAPLIQPTRASTINSISDRPDVTICSDQRQLLLRYPT